MAKPTDYIDSEDYVNAMKREIKSNVRFGSSLQKRRREAHSSGHCSLAAAAGSRTLYIVSVMAAKILWCYLEIYFYRA
jgi:hypothetical protein